MTSTASRMTGEDRRDQLLAVARTLFAQSGYRTTTAHVAREAGVSEALVIKHFGSKEGLFRAAIADPAVELFEDALAGSRRRAALQNPSSPREHLEHLKRFGVEWAELVAANRSLILTLAREASQFPDVTSQLLEMLAGIVDEVVESLREYAASDDYAEFDPRMATTAALGALTAAALVGTEPAAFAERYFEMSFLGVLSPASSARAGLRATGESPR